MEGDPQAAACPVWLGLTWRGHLLALLRAAYQELDEEHVRSLGLVGLG